MPATCNALPTLAPAVSLPEPCATGVPAEAPTTPEELEELIERLGDITVGFDPELGVWAVGDALTGGTPILLGEQEMGALGAFLTVLARDT